MDRRWLALVGVLAFAVTLAVITGNRLATTGALTVVFGMATGVAAGVVAALTVIRLAQSRNDWPDGRERTTLVMPTEQAERLIKMLNSRRQADPDAFPMVSERERRISVVGGASLDGVYDDE